MVYRDKADNFNSLKHNFFHCTVIRYWKFKLNEKFLFGTQFRQRKRKIFVAHRENNYSHNPYACSYDNKTRL